jgi:long-chain acyl-CoA synthetase
MHTIADPIERAMRTASEQEAVVCGDVRLSYAELADRLRRLGGALRGLGLQRGDRVAILAANCHRYIETYLAVPAAGFVLVPLNTRHAEPELRYALADSGARVLITDRPADGFRDLVETVVQVPDDYDRLVAGADPGSFDPDLNESSLAGIFYTGGTTGASKGVMLTHRNLIANALELLVIQNFTSADRYAVIAPLFHAAGSFAVLATTWTGGCQVVLPAFDPASAVDLIADEGITATLVVPTMLAAMADEQLAGPRPITALRHLAHGGSPCATEVLRRAHKAFPSAELIHYYGTTETAPIATAMPREEHLLDGPRGRSCGQPVVGVDVRVAGPDGEEVPQGEVGEIVIRGANVMAGYWNKPKETAAALVDGWYRSGDLGYQDDEGFVYLVDRAKDMIVTGGENVYCTEVEEVLYLHQSVAEAAVFGVPHERWGEAVHAIVVPREDVETKDLIAFCRERIASYKVPLAIELRADPLPKSGPGKVLKRELREPYWRDRDVRIG